VCPYTLPAQLCPFWIYARRFSPLFHVWSFFPTRGDFLPLRDDAHVDSLDLSTSPFEGSFFYLPECRVLSQIHYLTIHSELRRVRRVPPFFFIHSASWPSAPGIPNSPHPIVLVLPLCAPPLNVNACARSVFRKTENPLCSPKKWSISPYVRS